MAWSDWLTTLLIYTIYLCVNTAFRGVLTWRTLAKGIEDERCHRPIAQQVPHGTLVRPRIPTRHYPHHIIIRDLSFTYTYAW